MVLAPTGSFATSVRALAAAAGCGGLAAALGEVAARIAADLDPAAVGGRGLEGGVALLFVAVGGVALGVMAVGCLLTAVGAATRLCGRTLTRLESTASRLTPALLRRAIAVGVGTGLLASVAGGATAVEPADPGAGTPAQQDAADAGAPHTDGSTPAVLNLGWQVTSGAAPTADAGGATGGGEVDGATTVPTGATSVPTGATTVPTGAPGALPAAASPTALPSTAADAPTRSAGAQSTPAGNARPAADDGSAAPARVTVRPGDTLWAIAAAHLPAGSGDAEIAAAWPRWYQANRAVVGDDPDVIHPGQVLTAPVEEHS